MCRRLPPVNSPGGLVDLSVLKSTALCFYAAATFTCFLGIFTGKSHEIACLVHVLIVPLSLVLTYIGVSAQRKGVPENITTYLVAISNAASAVGRVGAGIIADKHGTLMSLQLSSRSIHYCLYRPSDCHTSDCSACWNHDYRLAICDFRSGLYCHCHRLRVRFTRAIC